MPLETVMFARVTTVQAPPGRIEESARYVRERVLPAVQSGANRWNISAFDAVELGDGQ